MPQGVPADRRLLFRTHPSSKKCCPGRFGWKVFSLPFLDKQTKDKKETSIIYFLKKKELQKLYHITTASGHVLKATGDHPLMTDRGMVPAAQLSHHDKIVSYGFKGIQYEQPSADVILDKKTFITFLQEK